MILHLNLSYRPIFILAIKSFVNIKFKKSSNPNHSFNVCTFYLFYSVFQIVETMNMYYDNYDINNLKEETCDRMDNIANSRLLLGVLIVHDTFAICSIPCLLLLIQKSRKHPLMHYNTRFILVFHLLCLIFHQIARVNQHSTDIYRYLKPRTSGCDILPSVKYCFTIRLPYNCALWASYSSTIMIAFERLIATKNVGCYSQNRTIGPIFVICQLLATSVLLFIIYLPTKFSTKVIYYCLAMSASQPLYTSCSLAFMMGVQLVAIIIFKRLIVINKKIKQNLRTRGNVQGRYQVEQTIRSLKTLTPFFFTCCAFIFSYLAVMAIVITFNNYLPRSVYFSLIEGSNFIPQYSLFLPVMLWYQNMRIIKMVQNKLKTEIATKTDKYHDVLESMWA